MSAFNLTSRELEITERLMKGWSNKHIANDLNITPNTVRVHLQNIYLKMNVHNRFEAMIKLMNYNPLLDYDTL